MWISTAERKLGKVKFTGTVLMYGQIVYQRKLTLFRSEAVCVFWIMYKWLLLYFQAPGSRNLGGMEDTWGRLHTVDGSIDLWEPGWYCCMCLAVYLFLDLINLYKHMYPEDDYAVKHEPLTEMLWCMALKQDWLPLPEAVWY